MGYEMCDSVKSVSDPTSQISHPISRLYNSSIIAKICPSSNPLRSIAAARQDAVQTPHPLHRASLTTARPVSGSSSIALYAQTSTQVPQPLQRTSRMLATFPSASRVVLASTVAARPAAVGGDGKVGDRGTVRRVAHLGIAAQISNDDDFVVHGIASFL